MQRFFTPADNDFFKNHLPNQLFAYLQKKELLGKETQIKDATIRIYSNAEAPLDIHSGFGKLPGVIISIKFKDKNDHRFHFKNTDEVYWVTFDNAGYDFLPDESLDKNERLKLAVDRIIEMIDNLTKEVIITIEDKDNVTTKRLGYCTLL